MTVSRRAGPAFARAAARFENLATLPNGALNQPVTVPESGRRREITKREAVFAQPVNKSASADPRSLEICSTC